MSLSLLDTHRVKLSNYDPLAGPHLFDLNCNLAGISITDQMRRGHGIVVEALDKKIIGPDKPLLIIGAGVGGMMAAATAARNKIPTRVIEKSDRPFSVQANCPSRWVCPTQYSWPDDEWTRGVYPHDDRIMPFVWRRGLADVEADVVRQKIEKSLEQSDDVKVLLRTEFKRFSLYKHRSGQWRVIPRLDVIPADPKFPIAFAMAVACTGFGEENTVVQKNAGTASAAKYTGHIFWELDKYEDDNPHLGMHAGQPNVLISGSGDGALQDFLRVATRIDAAQVTGRTSIRRVGSAGALYLLAFKSVPATARRISRRIKMIEQVYQQELADPRSRQRDHEFQTLYKCCVNAEAHLEHLILIKELCKATAVWRRVVDSLDRLVKDLRNEIRIKILYPCFHISPYYGLNRFMTLLLVAYAYHRYPDVQLLFPENSVTKIVGAGAHAAPGDTCKEAGYCHGKAHRVFSAPADCLSVGSPLITGESEFENGPYNAVIVRHGILTTKRIKVLAEDRLAR